MINYLLNLEINDYNMVVFAWNIFLALIPCVIAYFLQNNFRYQKWGVLDSWHKVEFLILFIIWFFFFPNTAYLMSDIRHLVNYCDHPGLYRMCKDQAYIVPIFFTYALIGLPTFYYALSKMATTLKQLFNQTSARLLPILMIPLTSLGLMLGLVARYNSWDVILKPFKIIHTTFLFLADPVMLLNILSYTVMLYLIYYFIQAVRSK